MSLVLDDNTIKMLAQKCVARLEAEGIGEMLSGTKEAAYKKAGSIISELSSREVMQSNDEGQEYNNPVEDINGGTARMSADQYREADKRETNYLRVQADRIYFSGLHPNARQRANTESIKREFADKSRQHAHRSNAAQKTAPKRPDFLYESNKLLTSDGTEKQYKIAKHKVNWGCDFLDGDIEGNLNILIKYITDNIESQFGGWTRIHEIYVRDQRLIINGIQYLPILGGGFEGKFPLDCFELLKNGCTAPLFDWSRLRKMKALTVFDIDDINFYVTSVADGLGLSRRIGAGSIFRICPNLRVFVVGGMELLRGEEYTEKSVKMKRALAREKHFLNLFDGLNLDICAGTNKLTSWTFNNLKTYVCNRGNKGLLRYCGGLLGHTAMVACAGTVNIGAHVMKNIGRTVKAGLDKLRDASNNV